MHQDLFVYDKNLKQLNINKIEVWTIPAFATLQKRHKSLKGLTPVREGELLVPASRELLYVYLMEDPRSILYAQEEDSKRQKAIRMSALPREYTEDAVVLEARKIWRKLLKLTPNGKSFITASKTFNAISESLEETQEHLSFLRKTMSSRISIIKDDATTDSTKDLELTNALAVLKQIKDTQADIIKNLERLPNLSDIVEKLKATWASELGNQKLLVGDRKLGNRED